MQTDIRGIPFVPYIAHISLETGEVFQVLKRDENGQTVDWDEEATVAALDQFIASLPPEQQP